RQAHFNLLSADMLKNEIHLLELVKAKNIQDRVNASVDQLFTLALPSKTATTNNKEDFDHFWQTSGKLQGIYKARYLQSDWEEVVKPLNDKLRTHQRNALIAYLLNQKALKDWGVTDADGLFEFFLIDVQMEACMETSRIRQAISSVQTFVQRVFLDLESPNMENGDFDDRRQRWEWMNRYRIWEANRKVFCYPENWLRSELRDDKSPFYKELESELLQKDVNPSIVKEALQNYLYKLDEVADMKVVGIFNNSKDNRIHVVSRTRNVPYFYYYRSYNDGDWYPWEKIQVDIPNYDHIIAEKVISSGSYIIPVEWNNRIFIFFPIILKKTKAKSNTDLETFESKSKKSINLSKPYEFWEIKMAFSEKKHDKWTQKVISEKAAYTSNLIDINKFNFDCELGTNLRITFGYFIDPAGSTNTEPYFEFDGHSLTLYNTSGAIALANTDNFSYESSGKIFSYPNPYPDTFRANYN
ncbi:MAG TPA: neuraminidase-like domain-containing protein, partial [Saprospiraceae bacterium]|nr:neuraminidase-like domain-containing protein [Saprospiraceae bacterium]